MRKFTSIEMKVVIRTVMEWMIDDYALADIINQAISKWTLTEKEAINLLAKVRLEWIKNEQENNEQKRLRKIESLKKLKRGMSAEERRTASGVSALLSLEKELFRLEAMAPSKILNGIDKLPQQIKLTAREERFCVEWARTGNGTQSAITAGYSKRTAATIASENLRKPHVVKFIEIIKEDVRKRAELDTDMVVQELRDLGESNIQDYLDPDNTIKDITTLTRAQTKAISSIKSRQRILPDGTKEVITELKLHDRRATWVDLGRHVGIFEKDNKQKALKIKVTRK